MVIASNDHPYSKFARQVCDIRQFFLNRGPVHVLPRFHLRFDVAGQRAFSEMYQTGLRRRGLFHDGADMLTVLPDIWGDKRLSARD